jgi:archaellum biogenesis protein FlaJ (TadC family)
LAEIPLLKISNAKPKKERVDAVVEFLKSRGSAKSRKVKTLSNSIKSLLMQKLENGELSELLNELFNRKVVVVAEGNKVSYKLPE